MKALAMIEVYGYLAAVEALDSALKAANVNLFQVICTRGGLVTVLVTGDVGAVRAAADAAATAAGRVGSVLAVHIIPRPTEEIGFMLAGSPQGGHSPLSPAPSNKTPEEPEHSRLEQKALLMELLESEPNPEASEPPESIGSIDWRTLSDEELHQLTVPSLRAIVRSLEHCSMTRKEIRFGKKEELIAEIQKFCGQEG